MHSLNLPDTVHYPNAPNYSSLPLKVGQNERIAYKNVPDLKATAANFNCYLTSKIA